MKERIFGTRHPAEPHPAAFHKGLNTTIQIDRRGMVSSDVPETSPSDSILDVIRSEHSSMSDEEWIEDLALRNPVETPEQYTFYASLMEEMAHVPPEGVRRARFEDSPPPPLEAHSQAVIPKNIYAAGLKWDVGAQIGGGGFGNVHEIRYAGQDTQRKRVVKFMFMRDDEIHRSALWNEIGAAMLAGDFVGSEVVQDDKGATWAAIILERHAGDTAMAYLHKRREERAEDFGHEEVETEPNRFFQVAVMLRSILHTLRRMHALGWSHRDVKPGNVIFNTQEGEEWLSRLIDFGTAVREGRVRKRMAQRITGTLSFMLPESIKNEDVDLVLRDYWGAVLTAALALGVVKINFGTGGFQIMRALEEGTYIEAARLDDPRVAEAYFRRNRFSPEQRAFAQWLYDFLRPHDYVARRHKAWVKTGIVKFRKVSSRPLHSDEWVMDEDETPQLRAMFLDEKKFLRELEGHVRALGVQVGRKDVEEHLALLQEFPAS